MANLCYQPPTFLLRMATKRVSFFLRIFKLNFDVAYSHLFAGLKYKHHQSKPRNLLIFDFHSFDLFCHFYSPKKFLKS